MLIVAMGLPTVTRTETGTRMMGTVMGMGIFRLRSQWRGIGTQIHTREAIGGERKQHGSVRYAG